VRDDAPDELVTAICAGLDLRRDRIPHEGHSPLPIAHMCRDTPDGPLNVPLHPAAERYWHARGYDTTPSGLRGQQQERRVPGERPPRIRSMLTLEVASEILARAENNAPGAFATRIRLRQQTQDFDAWFATIVADADAIGSSDVAIVGAGSPLSRSLRRIGSIAGCDIVVRSGLADDVILAVRGAMEARRSELEEA
jgi:hypothetical protein